MYAEWTYFVNNRPILNQYGWGFLLWSELRVVVTCQSLRHHDLRDTDISVGTTVVDDDDDDASLSKSVAYSSTPSSSWISDSDLGQLSMTALTCKKEATFLRRHHWQTNNSEGGNLCLILVLLNKNLPTHIFPLSRALFWRFFLALSSVMKGLDWGAKRSKQASLTKLELALTSPLTRP